MYLLLTKNAVWNLYASHKSGVYGQSEGVLDLTYK